MFILGVKCEKVLDGCFGYEEYIELIYWEYSRWNGFLELDVVNGEDWNEIVICRCSKEEIEKIVEGGIFIIGFVWILKYMVW